MADAALLTSSMKSYDVMINNKICDLVEKGEVYLLN